jgi:hypothetical protein
MAESSLSLGYPDLALAVAEYLNYDVDSNNWTALQTAEIDRQVQSGYRQFLYPPAMDGLSAGYEWTFMKPTVTIETTADDEDQDLPDDFGRLVNGFSFDTADLYPQVLADVGEARIRELRQQFDETDRPRVAAIRIKSSDGTTGQRREVMWYPTPDAAYTLSYRYEAFTGKLTDANPYPLGGAKHAELIRESCLAAAEAFLDETRGTHWDNFSRQLLSAVMRDKRDGTDFFGNVGTKGEYDDEHGTGLYRHSPYGYSLTVSGYPIQ